MPPKGGCPLNRIQILLAIVILSAFVGCSTGQSPVTSDPGPDQITQNSGIKSNRTIWGYWTIRIDPESETVEIVPDRGAGSHFNVVRLLEVAPCTDCLGISNLSWLPNNIIQCDFQLTHPFPGLIKLTGFDVRGVLVADGDTLFPANNRFVSLDGSNPALINPDGFTALFNPVEFPADEAPIPILGYFPGKLAFGDNFTGTLNPFMAFSKVNPRRMFMAGDTESVTINMKYPSVPFQFGYVVDASWMKVDVVIDPETDFPPEANCLEPYSLEFQMITELTNEQGDSALIQIEIFDHQGVDTISTVSIECPSLFDGEVFLSYSSQSGDDSWLYEGVITNENGVSAGSYPVLVSAISLESDANLGELAAYQIEEISVLPTENWIMVDYPNGGEMFYGSDSCEIQWQWTGAITNVYIFYSTDSGANYDGTVILGADCTGSFMWDPIPDIDTTQARIKIIDVDNSATFDESDEDFAISAAGDGDLIWAKRAGGMLVDSGYAVTTLSDNSTVVTGYFEDSATFGPGESSESVLVSDGYADIFVARYNTDGTLAWVKRAGGTENDYSYGITTLSNDSTVVTGHFRASATFGPGESAETVLVSDGSGDIFVARYNPDGTLAWAKRAGGIGFDTSYGITTLSNDSTVVTGIFYGSATFGPGESAETPLVSDGGNDIFVVHYNTDGTIVWGKRAGGLDDDRGYGITTRSDNTTVVTGYFETTATFGKGESAETSLVSDGGNDIFVVLYNTDGTIAWGKRAGGLDDDRGSGITTRSDDSIVVIGRFRGSATFGKGEIAETSLVSAGENDIFLVHCNTDGTIAWGKRAGGINDDYCDGITILSDDSTVVTGLFSDIATFGKGEINETVLVSDGGFDVFVARNNTDGTLAWAKRAGGTDYDYGSGITLLSDDSTVVTGAFQTSAIFGEGEPGETVLVSDGQWDIFVARFAP